MSTRDLRRWVVLRRVRDRELSLREAATLLGLCYRQVRRLLRRVRAHGQRGLVHGNVGKRSNRARPVADRTKAMVLIRQHFSGTVEGTGQRFGPTLAAQHLAEEFDLSLPVATLRRCTKPRPTGRRRGHCSRRHSPSPVRRCGRAVEECAP